MLLVSFWLSFVVFKFYVARTGNVNLARVVPCHMTYDEVTSMPLGIVWTQVLLISCSTCSMKLPFFQKAMTWLSISHVGAEGGVYVNWISEQMPPAHFCLSSVRKGGCIFRSLWYSRKYRHWDAYFYMKLGIHVACIFTWHQIWHARSFFTMCTRNHGGNTNLRQLGLELKLDTRSLAIPSLVIRLVLVSVWFILT